MVINGMVIDLAAAAVLLVAVILGAVQGLLKSLAGILTLVVSFLGARYAAEYLADPVTAWLQPLVQGRLMEKLGERTVSTASSTEMLSQFGFSGETLAELLRSVTEQVARTGQSVAEAVVGSVVHAMAYAVVFVLAFLVITLVLRLLIRPLDLAAKLPVVRTVNALGGIALHLLEAAVLLLLAVWLLQRLQIITPALAEESILLRLLAENHFIDLVTST